MALTNDIATCIIDQVDVKDLHACTLVNRQLHTIANPYLYRSLSIKSADQFTQLMTGLESTVSNVPLGTFVRHVQLNDALNTDQLLPFATRTPYLECLVLRDGSQLTDKSWKKLLPYWPKLKSLSVRASPMTIRSIRSLGQSCHDMTVLRLENCTGLSTKFFDTLVLSCPVLQELDVDVGGMQHLRAEGGPTVGGVTYLAHEVAYRCAFNLAQLAHLTHLTIRDSPPLLSKHILMTKEHPMKNNTGSDTVNKGGGFLRRLRLCHFHQPGWTQLLSLSLGSCAGTKDQPTMDFLVAHTQLRTLVLDGISISDTVLYTIRAHLHNLTYLDLSSSTSRVTALAIRRLVIACERLEYVGLKGNGILASQFPEAGEACIDQTTMVVSPSGRGSGRRRVHKKLVSLDHQAIMGIRRTGLPRIPPSAEAAAYENERRHLNMFFDDRVDMDHVQAFSKLPQATQDWLFRITICRMKRLGKLYGNDD